MVRVVRCIRYNCVKLRYNYTDRHVFSLNSSMWGSLCSLVHHRTWITFNTMYICFQKFAPEAPGPVSDEVSDLQQRFTVLLQKRAEDKGKIKELEKYKAQFNQVNVFLLLDLGVDSLTIVSIFSNPITHYYSAFVIH